MRMPPCTTPAMCLLTVLIALILLYCFVLALISCVVLQLESPFVPSRHDDDDSDDGHDE